VLFADVVDSTRLSQHLNPEDMLAVMEGALRRFAASIERHGGRVLRFAGEALTTMHAMLEQRAAKITDPDAQRMFRNNIAHNREIAAAWVERMKSGFQA
jgi:class 3 adenylate cyclase